MTTCVTCGEPSPSEVCSLCTAHMSQRAAERLLEMAEGATRMTGTMRSVCCVCGEQYGTKPCLPAMDGQTSHGLCGPACKAKMIGSL